MIAFLLSTTTLAASFATQVPPVSQPIVIIGQRIKGAEADLKSCIARRCATDEEIDAALRLAESQIVAGKYRDARATLLQSLSRNKSEAKRYPIPVSDLYRANGRVAAHLGFDKDYYASTWGMYRTLKEGLPSAEVRHFSALMEVAEMTGRTRGHERARLYYDSIARQARKAGRTDIAALAELRSYFRHYPPGAVRDRGIQRIANATDPHMRAASLEAKLTLARIAFEQKDEAAAKAIQAELARLDIKQPILIYAPSYAMVEQEISGADGLPVSYVRIDPGSKKTPQGTPMGGLSVTKRMAGNFDDMWIDVGFRITPEGKVADAMITRSKGELFWTKPLMASIQGRRYTAGKDNDPASYRTERYTYTSAYEAQTGTRLSERSPQGRVEYFDLSPMGISAPQ